MLTQQQKQELDYSFESGDANYVLVDDYFVGVHVVGNPNLEILEMKGAWSYGRINSIH